MKAIEAKNMPTDTLAAIIVHYTQSCDALQHLPDNTIGVIRDIGKFLSAINEYYMHFTELYLGCLAATMHAESFPKDQSVLEDSEFIYDPSSVGRWDMHVASTRLRVEALAMTILKMNEKLKHFSS